MQNATPLPVEPLRTEGTTPTPKEDRVRPVRLEEYFSESRLPLSPDRRLASATSPVGGEVKPLGSICEPLN